MIEYRERGLGQLHGMSQHKTDRAGQGRTWLTAHGTALLIHFLPIQQAALAEHVSTLRQLHGIFQGVVAYHAVFFNRWLLRAFRLVIQMGRHNFAFAVWGT